MARRPTTTNADDIAPRQLKHDPADFIVPARDARGESVRMWNRIQPGHDRAISVIVNSKKFPFKTPGDVVRYCLHKQLAILEKMEGLPSVTQQVEAMLGVLRDEEFHQEFQAFLSHATTVVNRHVGEGADGEARRVVARLKHEIEKMPDGHWKGKYGKMLQTQFGHLLADKKSRVGLVPTDEDDD